MRIALFTLLFLCQLGFSQGQVASGFYDGLKLAYNPETMTVTGYFEDATGFDEEYNAPKFTCIFYLEGKLTDGKAEIQTYFPNDSDIITGTLKRTEDNGLTIHLKDEHGGCWNVRHFADAEAAYFPLIKKENWIEINYVTAEQSFFYSDKKESSKKKMYLIKGDVICVDKAEGDWVHCTYFSKKTVDGWVKKETLNTPSFQENSK